MASANVVEPASQHQKPEVRHAAPRPALVEVASVPPALDEVSMHMSGIRAEPGDYYASRTQVCPLI